MTKLFRDIVKGDSFRGAESLGPFFKALEDAKVDDQRGVVEVKIRGAIYRALGHMVVELEVLP